MLNAMKPLGRAVCWGALAGGGPLLLITVPITIGALGNDLLETEMAAALFFAVSPILYTALATFAGMVTFGIPLTAYLRRLGDEHARTYRYAGLGIGFILPLLLAAFLSGFSRDVLPFGLLLAALGAAAGHTTAAVWGAWRESMAADHKSAYPQHPNRIDDPRILR